MNTEGIENQSGDWTTCCSLTCGIIFCLSSIYTISALTNDCTLSKDENLEDCIGVYIAELFGILFACVGGGMFGYCVSCCFCDDGLPLTGEMNTEHTESKVEYRV